MESGKKTFNFGLRCAAVLQFYVDVVAKIVVPVGEIEEGREVKKRLKIRPSG